MASRLRTARTLGGLTEFEIRAQDAEVLALELGHAMQDWHKGKDKYGHKKWLAPCTRCGALMIAEYENGRPSISGSAVRVKCKVAKANADRRKELRAHRFRTRVRNGA